MLASIVAAHFIVLHEVVEYKLVRRLNYWSGSFEGEKLDGFNKFKGWFNGWYEPRFAKGMANGVLVPVAYPSSI